MTADHLVKTIWKGSEFINEYLFLFMDKWITPGFFIRIFGRLAFPIFAFLLTEGFVHTCSRSKYALRLFILALISEIPYDLCMYGSVFYSGNQNIFFTLLLGLLGFTALEEFKKNRLNGSLLLAGIALLAITLNVDYELKGVLFIILLYLIKNNYVLQALTAGTLLPYYGTAWLAAIPISMYNGERGFVRNKFLKYAFYLYYPLHLTIIFLIQS